MTITSGLTGDQFADKYPDISLYIYVMYKSETYEVWYENGRYWWSDHKRSGCLMTECITEVFV